eukprot:5334675-Alexandrium_andersonii.AAC.1
MGGKPRLRRQESHSSAFPLFIGASARSSGRRSLTAPALRHSRSQAQAPPAITRSSFNLPRPQCFYAA